MASQRTTHSTRVQLRTAELVAALPTADPADRPDLEHEVVLQNMPLARSIALSYAGRGIDTDDLCQVAYLALLKAARGYQPDRGPSFAAYAVPTIRGELRRHFRDHAGVVRPPRELQELRLAVAVAVEDLGQRLGREVTTSDLARALETSRDRIRQAKVAASNARPQSLEAGDSEHRPISERLADPTDDIAKLESVMDLRRAVARLDERAQTILRLRFVEDFTQARIAQELGISQMQVSRELSRILGRLRGRLGLAG